MHLPRQTDPPVLLTITVASLTIIITLIPRPIATLPAERTWRPLSVSGSPRYDA
jgi:hypothetical protein